MELEEAVAVNGQIMPDDDEGTVLVTFQVQIGMDGEEAEGGVSLAGSAIVKPGKPRPVADLGDKLLLLNVAQVK